MKKLFYVNHILLIALLFGASAMAQSKAKQGQNDADLEKQFIAEIKEAEKTPTDVRLADALEKLASFYITKSNFSEAEKLLKRSLEIRKKLFGQKHISIVKWLNHIGDVYLGQKKLDKAEASFIEAVKILESLKEYEHYEMSYAGIQLAGVYKLKNKPEVAENIIHNIPVIYLISGNIEAGIYTSREGDFKIRFPQLMKPGAMVRDEGEEGNGNSVIFTDDFGAFYRVFSFDNTKGAFSFEQIVGAADNPRDRQTLQSSRGREERFIDVEKEGSEITVKELKKNADKKSDKLEFDEKKPDLVTANCLFQSGNRFYLVTVGVSVIFNRTEATAAKLAKERLEQWLSQLEIVKAPDKQ